jgi:hypothetical protein
MSDAPRWVVVVVVLLVLVGLIAFARGRVHHRGDELGERASAVLGVSVGADR